MTTLNGLKLTAAQKPTQMTSVEQRRNKLAKRLWEQIELAKAQQTGTTFAPIKFRSITDTETGQRKQVEMTKRVKAWWFVAENGEVCFSVKYGSWTLELAKGKPSIEVANAEELVNALMAVKEAVEAGELDSQIQTASASLRSGFRHSFKLKSV